MIVEVCHISLHNAKLNTKYTTWKNLEVESAWHIPLKNINKEDLNQKISITFKNQISLKITGSCEVRY